MDMNLVVLAGRVADDPVVKVMEGGSTNVRVLVTTRSEGGRNRIDVIPVVLWDPEPSLLIGLEKGVRVWCVGRVQRRFWTDGRDGRASAIEVIAWEIVPQFDNEEDSDE